MNYIDYIIIVIVLVGFLLGFKDGLVRKIIGLVGLIVGVVLAYKFAAPLGKLLNSFFNHDEYLANVIAGILIFLTVILIASVMKRIIHPVDKVNRLLNQTLGGIIGAIQITFFVSAVLLFLNIFQVPSGYQRAGSLTYNFVSNLIPKTVDLLIGRSANPADYIKELIEKKDSDASVPVDSIKINVNNGNKRRTR